MALIDTPAFRTSHFQLFLALISAGYSRDKAFHKAKIDLEWYLSQEFVT